jgi:hypothetical protein
MSTENKPVARYETILNQVRREAQKIRESNDKLRDLRDQLVITEHPAPAETLGQTTTTIQVALEHVRNVFKEF